jgi:hypothetical protein
MMAFSARIINNSHNSGERNARYAFPEAGFRHGSILMLTLALTAFLLFTGCSPRLSPDGQGLQMEGLSESETPADSLISYMKEQQGVAQHPEGVQAIRGRAAARVSMPGSSEQATLRFTSDPQQSLLSFRNNLGIEGGRIYANTDSVLIYDRIEKTARKMSVEASRYALLNGFTAFNIITLLFPEIQTRPAPRVFEDAERWVILTDSGQQYEIGKENGLLRRVRNPSADPKAYNQFIFSEYASIDGIKLPRRIQILSNDEESSIFLLVQALEINPEAPGFDPQIPDDIQVERF